LDERELRLHLERLEDALTEYAERYGLTDKARIALSSSVATQARGALGQPPSDDRGDG
jgi:hypothetical protein